MHYCVRGHIQIGATGAPCRVCDRENHKKCNSRRSEAFEFVRELEDYGLQVTGISKPARKSASPRGRGSARQPVTKVVTGHNDWKVIDVKAATGVNPYCGDDHPRNRHCLVPYRVDSIPRGG
jgi:hypothetical protein